MIYDNKMKRGFANRKDAAKFYGEARYRRLLKYQPERFEFINPEITETTKNIFSIKSNETSNTTTNQIQQQHP